MKYLATRAFARLLCPVSSSLTQTHPAVKRCEFYVSGQLPKDVTLSYISVDTPSNRLIMATVLGSQLSPYRRSLLKRNCISLLFSYTRGLLKIATVFGTISSLHQLQNTYCSKETEQRQPTPDIEMTQEHHKFQKHTSKIDNCTKNQLHVCRARDSLSVNAGELKISKSSVYFFLTEILLLDIPENTDPGHIVLTLSATDKDSPHTPFSMITYGFETSGCQNWFELVNITGKTPNPLINR